MKDEGRMKYRKKQNIVDAEQWFEPVILQGTGAPDMVDSYKFGIGPCIPLYASDKVCNRCGRLSQDHGLIEYDPADSDAALICPGDWVITEVGMSQRIHTDAYFKNVYEKVLPTVAIRGGSEAV